MLSQDNDQLQLNSRCIMADPYGGVIFLSGGRTDETVSSFKLTGKGSDYAAKSGTCRYQPEYLDWVANQNVVVRADCSRSH